MKTTAFFLFIFSAILSLSLESQTGYVVTFAVAYLLWVKLYCFSNKK